MVYPYNDKNLNASGNHTAQKMKFSIKGFFSKCDQICKKLRIWSHLLKKSLIENFIFCVASRYLIAFNIVKYLQQFSYR